MIHAFACIPTATTQAAQTAVQRMRAKGYTITYHEGYLSFTGPEIPAAWAEWIRVHVDEMAGVVKGGGS